MIKDLKKREEISSNLLDPISKLQNSIVVEYKDLKEFLKSFASEHTELSRDEIETFVSNSPTKKLRSPTDEDLFVNFSEIKELKQIWNFKYLENMKLLKQNANNVFG